MLSDQDVVDAYRFFLGRLPETTEVVAVLRRRLGTLDELRAEFMRSPEFRSQLALEAAGPVGSKPLDWLPIDVEHDASPEALAAMLAHIKENWRLLGLSEPHWSVLSDERFRASRIDENKDEFFTSGRYDVGLFEAALARAGVAVPAGSRCLELGCGLGRVTLWLAKLCDAVIGIDVSPSHLHLARRRAAERHADTVEFRQLTALDDIEALPVFDVFFSLIVLQHNPPPVIGALLRTILTKLKPGGIGYFQLPTYHRHYVFTVEDYTRRLHSIGSIEMHVFPQKALFALVAACGCDLLEIREDGWTALEDGVSNSVLVRKRA